MSSAIARPGDDAPASFSDSSGLLRRYARHRDPADLDRLVRRFRPLARKLALKYARGSEPLEDLEQVAALGLLKALDRFDPEKGYAFTSFAVPTILGELKRSFRDSAWSAHVPRSVQERVAAVRDATETHFARDGHAPSVAQLAERLDCDEEFVIEALGAAHALAPLSLDARTRDTDQDDGDALVDKLGGDDDGYELAEDRSAIETALRHLTSMERRVIALRFEEDLKQSEIAERLGCSQMQISRVLRRGLERLTRLAEHQSG